MKTNIELVNYCKSMLGHPYIYGCFGQTLTETLLTQKATQYPKELSEARVKTARTKYIGKTVTDCSGLIKGFMMGASEGEPVYNGKYDLNARGMYNASKNRGMLSEAGKLKIGALVFNKSLTHVGVWTGSEVIEAKGFNYGVRKGDLSSFFYYGEYHEIEYVKEVVNTKPTEVRIIAKSGLWYHSEPNDKIETRLGAFNFYDKVTVTELVDGWYKTNKGWISAYYVRLL